MLKPTHNEEKKNANKRYLHHPNDLFIGNVKVPHELTRKFQAEVRDCLEVQSFKK
jgi:hypothetical protein